jgi:hypothetical protein
VFQWNLLQNTKTKTNFQVSEQKELNPNVESSVQKELCN